MSKEIYKQVTIPKFDYYKVSNKGNVINTKTNNILKPSLKMGYHYASFVGNKKIRLHRLVALAFIPNDNPTAKTFVNHKNGNKLDNRVENLEWVTPSDNVKHAYTEKLIKPFERKVCKLDEDGNVLETFNSLKEAKEKTKIDDGSIVKVCKGRQQTAGGFKWKYKEIFENETIAVNVNLDEMKAVDNYPNYRVSNDGKVYSIRYKKYLKFQVNSDGYQTVQLANNKVKKDYLVHRLVATYFADNPDNKDKVNHKNGNKLDNKLENLEWVTDSENVLHYHNSLKNK